MPRSSLEPEKLLTPAECAAIWKVDPKTVTRWAKAGKVHSIRTIGGHRRFFLREIEAMIRGEEWEPAGGWPPNSG